MHLELHITPTTSKQMVGLFFFTVVGAACSSNYSYPNSY